MTVLYFSSTGNSLYVAKRIGGERLSIPVCIEEKVTEIEDEEIGIVFPIYGLTVPPFIEEFIKSISVECEYFFAIATYGFFPGAVCGQLKGISTGNGRHFDYINRLKMGENCVTFSDMAISVGDSKNQQLLLTEILDDIKDHKAFIRKDSPFKKFMTKNHINNYEFPTGVGITDSVRINDNCVGCKTCEKVCPMNNINIVENKPLFGNNCVSCGACIQHCPQNALHHIKEKSEARYRNPHVDLQELFIS